MGKSPSRRVEVEVGTEIEPVFTDLQSNPDRKYIKSLGVKRYQDKTGTDEEPDTSFHQRIKPIWTPLRRAAVLADDTDAQQPATRAFGPKRALDYWQMLPCSFSKPDVLAWHSEIEQAQSTLRDLAAARPCPEDGSFCALQTFTPTEVKSLSA